MREYNDYLEQVEELGEWVGALQGLVVVGPPASEPSCDAVVSVAFGGPIGLLMPPATLPCLTCSWCSGGIGIRE